jgi:putative endonuclease
MRKHPAVYILASRRNGTLYIGVTSDLMQRIAQHKSGTGSKFSELYQTNALVHYELHPDMRTAIKREKQLKKWNRAWKLNLIETMNPHWADLYDEIAE